MGVWVNSATAPFTLFSYSPHNSMEKGPSWEALCPGYSRNAPLLQQPQVLYGVHQTSHTYIMYLHIHVYTLTHICAHTSCVNLQKKVYLLLWKLTIPFVIDVEFKPRENANVGLAPLQDLTNSTRCSPLWKANTCWANQENYRPHKNHYRDFKSTPMIPQPKSPSSGIKHVRKIMKSGFVSVCLSVRPSARNKSAPTGRNSKQFHTWIFYDNLSKIFQLD